MTIEPAALPQKRWDTKEIVSWIRTERLYAERHREPWLRLFLQCLRFWAGDHWRDIVESTLSRWDTRQIRPIGTEDFRLTDNQIPTYCRHLTAQATANMPQIRAIPADAGDPEDVMAAQIGTRFLDWRVRQDNEALLRETAWLWMLGTGETLRYTGLDAEGGDPLFGEGDITTTVIDPFRYLKDPQSIMEWPPKYLIVSEARHVDWIKDTYGIAVEPETVADTSLFYDALAMNVVWGGQHQEREQLKNAAMVNQFWIPPGKRYPRGWLYVQIGERLVQSAPLQLSEEDENRPDPKRAVWPFAKSGWYPLPGRMYAMGLIELMMGDSRQLDSLVSLLQEAASKQVRGDIVVTGPLTGDGRGIRQFVYNAKTGAKITALGPGVEIAPMNYGADWTQAETRRQQISQNLHEKSGVNQPSLGQTLQKEARVGELLMAREGDSQVTAWHLGRYGDQDLIPTARLKLALARQFYILPRILEGIGTEQEAMAFQGIDLKDTRDVIAVSIPYMTPAMKQQAKGESYAQGLLGPFVNPDGSPSLAKQYAARMTLRNTGLDELDKQLATVYGPFEELEVKVKQLQQVQEAAEMVAGQMLVQQIMNPAPPEAMAKGVAA